MGLTRSRKGVVPCLVFGHCRQYLNELSLRNCPKHRLCMDAVPVSRCETVLKNVHKRSLKQWKAEQQTLSEVEFEWLRQFYIQGRAHYDLHEWWHGPLLELLGFWSRLEERTEVLVRMLEAAAEFCVDDDGARGQSRGQVGGNDGNGNGNDHGDLDHGLDRKEKKARQKRAKQKQAVEAAGGRSVYEAIAEALRDRAEKRKLWLEREVDKVFSRLPEDASPIPCPLFVDPFSPSSLPDNADDLEALANSVAEWGEIYSGEKKTSPQGGLPKVQQATTASSVNEDGGGGKTASGVDDAGGGSNSVDDAGGAGDDNGDARDHCEGGSDRAREGGGEGSKDDRSRKGGGSGDGKDSAGEPGGGQKSSQVDWKTGQFALEVQAPWSQRLLDGAKTVETRSYPLPNDLLKRFVFIMESQPGKDGVSSVGEVVEAGSPGLSLVGAIRFSSSEAYKSQEEWVADQSRHLVPPDSKEYGWKGPGSVYGWQVGAIRRYKKALPLQRRMTRRLRSLFEMGSEGSSTARDGEGTSKSKRHRLKKRKRHANGKGNGVGGEVEAVEGRGGAGGEVGASTAAVVREERAGDGEQKGEGARNDVVSDGAEGSAKDGAKQSKKRRKKGKLGEKGVAVSQLQEEAEPGSESLSAPPDRHGGVLTGEAESRVEESSVARKRKARGKKKRGKKGSAGGSEHNQVESVLPS